MQAAACRSVRYARFVVALVATGLLVSCDERAAPLALDELSAQWLPVDAADTQLTFGTTSTPEAQGMDSVKLADALLAIRDKHINVHSLLLARRGKVIVDTHFYPYEGTSVHDVASDTKSVMTTLIGIAADRGELSLDDSMLSFFSGRSIQEQSAEKARITLRHLVNMSSGLDCTKEGGERTLTEMMASADWVQFALDRKVVHEPGTYFSYCSPGMHLLSAILQRATGLTASEYAERYLFGPLGIRELIWPSDPHGYSRGWGDLKLHPHDLAKLGTLWRNHGLWHGKRIISRAWVDDAVQPLIDTREGDFYGYGWWVDTSDPASYRADGRGGQYVIVVPSLDLMLVTTGGGFNIDEISGLLLAALHSPDAPLPASLAGNAQLRAATRSVALAPAATPVPPLPEAAKRISGKTFIFEPNALELETLALEFSDSAEATLHAKLAGTEQALPLGLDGVYRMTSGDYGLPQGLRGAWSDDQSFVFEYDRIANNLHLVVRMVFAGDQVMSEATDLTRGSTVVFSGRLLSP